MGEYEKQRKLQRDYFYYSVVAAGNDLIFWALQRGVLIGKSVVDGQWEAEEGCSRLLWII